MRPVRKGSAYKYTDGDDYPKACDGLGERLGWYCSYCEQRNPSGIAVEHIQPKALPAFAHLECVWSNFLLACSSCNSCKLTKGGDVHNWIIPDRDNTFVAFVYRPDGVVEVQPGLDSIASSQAQATLDLLNLNKADRTRLRRERLFQRKEVWLEALDARQDWNAQPISEVANRIVTAAKYAGFFSIWMAAFEDVPEMRRRFIEAFPGTEDRCFDYQTTQPISPHPNEDNLPHGGKL